MAWTHDEPFSPLCCYPLKRIQFYSNIIPYRWHGVGITEQVNILVQHVFSGVVKVWNSSNGQLVQTLEGPGGAVEWVKWHPKGNVVLAGSDDFTMWMWLAQTGACMQVRLVWGDEHALCAWLGTKM